MSIEIARYQFHSWARRGISSNITQVDDLGSGSSTAMERAAVPVSVKLNGNALTEAFSLIGPGDIIGIHRDVIIRTEPLNWITDAEPNYLAFLEFYDEEFAWRYTPAAPQGEKLRPWIFLLVLKEEEFDRSSRTVPLSTITVKGSDVFPPAVETWLWAHVHSNADIPDAELSDYEKFLRSLNSTLNDDPDQLYCRLVSPRKLEPETPYVAFVIPAFETGRLAGLGEPTSGINAQLPSWDAGGARGEMPVYFEWFFRTGTNADFESLVNQLQPRPMDSRVGIRDMDCSAPGFVRADETTRQVSGTMPPVIGLEGALLAPASTPTVFPNPPESRDFQKELQDLVNLPAVIAADPAVDPIVSVPFYGQNHAKTSAADIVLLDTSSDHWADDLNRDPRTRVGAGFGTMVVQNGQETFMRKAWAQVAGIIEANRHIRATRLMMSVALQYTAKTFGLLQAGELLAIGNPVLKRVKGSPLTLYRLLRESSLPGAVFTGAFRRMVRPRGAIARKVAAGSPLSYRQIVDGLAGGKITASPPRTTPAGMFTSEDIARKLSAAPKPAWVMRAASLDSNVRLSVLGGVLTAATGGAFAVAGLAGAAAAFGAAGVGLAASHRYLNNVRDASNASAGILDPRKVQESIAGVPARPRFALQLSDEASPPPPTAGASGQDSVEARNFRTALAGLNTRLAMRTPEPGLAAFDLAGAATKLAGAIHPHVSFPYRLASLVKFPPSLPPLTSPENIFPAMAYPDFEDPMYKNLADISSELLLPNLQLIPNNTISLMKSNQKFVESYLVGLNHEMGRELLWREYPTDQRGSYFRQFWDVKGVIRPDDGVPEAVLAEEYKDIEPIHTWQSASLLGQHNNRNPQGNAETLVLVIRGDLLKRYPNTLIFAQKAVPGVPPDNDPLIDLGLDADGFKKEVRFPLFKADIPPDIKFFGFDLTVGQVRGDEPSPGFDDTLGWFFVLQQVPGEPRFGMDISLIVSGSAFTWDDLAWDCFGGAPPKFITSGVRPNPEPLDNHPDIWGIDSAHMAYILFQKPSMVAVHAKEMLESV